MEITLIRNFRRTDTLSSGWQGILFGAPYSVQNITSGLFIKTVVGLSVLTVIFIAYLSLTAEARMVTR